jgi:hypothetical protein
VKLGYNAKAEKRLTGFVCNFHPPLRTSFNWMVQITEYFAGGFDRFQLNRAYVGEFKAVAMVSLVPVTDHKKVSRHVSPSPLQSVATTFGYASYSAKLHVDSLINNAHFSK